MEGFLKGGGTMEGFLDGGGPNGGGTVEVASLVNLNGGGPMEVASVEVAP